MGSNDTPDHALLDRWREQGADRVDPLRFQYLLALHRRAATHGGAVRQALEHKLAAGIHAYAAVLPDTAGKLASAEPAATATAGLSALVRELQQQAKARCHGDAAAHAKPHPDVVPLPALQDVRALWANVRTDSQVQRSLASSPSNAGPLNSSHLVHRALGLMHDASPGYLQQFMAYLDALAWLEQLHAHGILATSRGKAQASSGKPRARARARKPRS